VHGSGPKYAQSVVQRTPADDGLAVVVYAPVNATVSAVGGGAHVAITTDYPFRDSVELRVTSKMAFPLHLRIPSWVAFATVVLDSGDPKTVAAGQFVVVKAGGGDTVFLIRLTFQERIRVEKGYNDSSVSVHRGPLLFAMDIGNGESCLGFG
jgi:DUF1680 family protein